MSAPRAPYREHHQKRHPRRRLALLARPQDEAVMQHELFAQTIAKPGQRRRLGVQLDEAQAAGDESPEHPDLAQLGHPSRVGPEEHIHSLLLAYDLVLRIQRTGIM